MANQEHLNVLKQGVRVWNPWRKENPNIIPDLKHADLRVAKLRGVNLSDSDLSGANLNRANLRRAKLLRANMPKVNLRTADLRGADLFRANLRESNLNHTILVEANLIEADISNSGIYGVSAWNVKIDNALQSDLIITKPGESEITVDNLEIAQFIYLLLNNSKIREVIDTITSKLVLILGRFTPERKAVLDSIKMELRKKTIYQFCLISRNHQVEI